MNEMELLARLRDQVPGEVLPARAESALLAAIEEEKAAGIAPRSRRPRPPGPWRTGDGRLGRRWPGWAAPLAAAAAVTAVIVGTSAILSAIHAPAPRPRAAGGTSPAIAWVADPHMSAGAVVPIRAATRTVLPPLVTGPDPVAFAITPDGKTIYVANSSSGTVTPIRTATNTALPAIRTGSDPSAIAITPDGRTAYVTNSRTGTVTPIRVASNTALRAIKVGGYPKAILITR